VVLKIYNMLLFFSLDTQYILFYGYLKIIVLFIGRENSWSLLQEFFIYNRSELTLYEFSFALGHQLYFQLQCGGKNHGENDSGQIT